MRDWVDRLMTMRSRVRVVEYALDLPRIDARDLTIAVVADLHVAAPWTTLDHVAEIVDRVNGLQADLIVLAGDYLAGHALPGRHASAMEITARLDELRAPHGVLAILGNHDWHDCSIAWNSRFTHCAMIDAFATTDIQLLRNEALRLDHRGDDLWIVGFDSQRPTGRDWSTGLHRPALAFQDVPDQQAAVLLAHEPDYFAQRDSRAALQISGHTHAGQLNLLGWRPMTPSQFGGAYAYGHKQDGDRQLIVSGGVGFSGLPMRIGAPPEITLLRINPAT